MRVAFGSSTVIGALGVVHSVVGRGTPCRSSLVSGALYMHLKGTFGGKVRYVLTARVVGSKRPSI